ncbi:hypothetical protein BJX99DRAFT_178248 [Aspergillus californicus]
MQLTSLLPLALSLLTATTTALPSSQLLYSSSQSSAPKGVPQSSYRVDLRTKPQNPALTWHVSDFDIGCSPGGCVYSFNVLGLASQNTPGFNTTCNGTTAESDYVACRNSGVFLSQVEPAGYPNWTVKGQHRWREGAYSDYYALGSANVTQHAENFTIPVSEVYGAA